MTLAEVKHACERQIAFHAEHKLASKPEVSFIVKDSWPRGGKKHLFGRRGPMGQCCAEYEDSVLCLFDAREVLDYIARIGKEAMGNA